jgi:hypothetical protein
MYCIYTCTANFEKMSIFEDVCTVRYSTRGNKHYANVHHTQYVDITAPVHRKYIFRMGRNYCYEYVYIRYLRGIPFMSRKSKNGNQY